MKKIILAKFNFAKSYIGIEIKALASLVAITIIFFCFEATSKLGFAMISSFIFYLVVIRHKQYSDKEKIKPFLQGSIRKITQECEQLLADFSQKSNTTIKLDTLTKDDINNVLSNILPNDTSLLTIPSPFGGTSYLSYMQNMVHRVSKTETHIDKMFRVNLDADLISKLSTIENCSYFFMVNLSDVYNVTNPNLSFISKQFYDYCVAVKELKNHTL